MAVANAARRLSEAEYLDIERAAEFRSEFYDGEMFAMPGGTATHSLITTNLIWQLGNKLEGSPCKVFTSDLRIKSEATGLYTYADAFVVCGDLQFLPGTDDNVLNPTVIFEVLSDSTEGYDRGEKFQHYRQIPSLHEYVLVNQRLPRIEQFLRRTEGEWAIRTAEGREATMAITALKIDLELSKVFGGVEFTPSTTRPQSKVQ